MTLSIQQFSLIILICINSFLLVILGYFTELSVASWMTSQEIQKDLISFEDIEKINSLLINTEIIKNISEQGVQAYNTLPILFSSVVVLTGITFAAFKWAIRDQEEVINSMIPKWQITEHSKIMIPVTIGIFVAISLSYFSSLTIVSSLRKQTIINNMILSIDTKQPEITNNLLVAYIQSNLSEYFSIASGFLYFLFALIFPILGAIIYYRNKKNRYWAFVLFATSALTIPFWIVMNLI